MSLLQPSYADEVDQGLREIPAYKDGADMDRFITNFEADMRDLGVSRRKYKRVCLQSSHWQQESILMI